MLVPVEERQVALGYKVQATIKEFEFCPDPDGTSLQWFKSTGKELSLEGYVKIGVDSRSNSGRCEDTAEYTSHLGELIKNLLSVAPEETGMMVVKTESGCGTCTFSERVEATFYKKD